MNVSKLAGRPARTLPTSLISAASWTIGGRLSSRRISVVSTPKEYKTAACGLLYGCTALTPIISFPFFSLDLYIRSLFTYPSIIAQMVPNRNNMAIMAASLFSLLGVVAARLDKPVIDPQIDFSKIDQGLLDHLPPTQSTVDQWGAGWIPRDCKDITEREGHKATDIEVFNVHYTDVRMYRVLPPGSCSDSFQCSDVWIMCRHKDSQMRYISIIPVHDR